MSRYVVNLEENKQFVYGFDHALGYFYELWDNNLEDEEGLLEDKCVLFNKLTRNDLIEIMEKNKANKAHIERVALDLPF